MINLYAISTPMQDAVTDDLHILTAAHCISYLTKSMPLIEHQIIETFCSIRLGNPNGAAQGLQVTLTMLVYYTHAA